LGDPLPRAKTRRKGCPQGLQTDTSPPKALPLARGKRRAWGSSEKANHALKEAQKSSGENRKKEDGKEKVGKKQKRWSKKKGAGVFDWVGKGKDS